jgi:site-specific DNA-methyltransferase (adenine-specific)
MLELRPIVIDENNMVLGGNMRLKACIEAGLTDVPVIHANNLSEEKKKEFIVKDNVGYGEWDWDDLANNWDALELTEWGLDIPNFEGEILEAEEDDFDVPVGGSETDIVLGDIFEIGQHKLLCGSSTQTDSWSKIFASELADLVITDPPYNVAYTGKTKDALTIQNDSMGDGDFYQFLYDFYTALGSYTKAGGSWYVWHADSEGANFRRAMADAGIMVKQCLIWVKNSMVMGRQDYQWKHEPCLYGWKEGAAHSWYSDRKQTTILEFNRPTRNAEHPTMKPIELISYQINNSSKQGDIVADAFLGSGTTMIASHQTNRICYGMELDPKYCQVIVDRMRKLDPTLEIKKNGVTLP